MYIDELVRDITVCEAHRNGVGGEPFTEIHFTTDYDGEPMQVIAIVTDDECYVVTPGNPEVHWRGSDYFGPVLRKWLDDGPVLDCCFGRIGHKSYCPEGH